MRPQLSIVTISYNDPGSLEKTLRSVEPLAATDLRWEHVVIDSSPALNREVLERFARKIPLVRFEQDPKGIYPAMNAGITRAQGEFIWFLHGGDELVSVDSLSAGVRALQADPGADLLLAAAELRRSGFASYVQHPRPGLAPMLGINRICQQAVLYRRSLFGRIGTFSEAYRLASDYEFHLRAHQTGTKSALLDRLLVGYDMEGQSSNSEKAFSEFQQIQRDLAKAGKLPMAWAHTCVRELEWAKTRFTQRLLKSPAGPQLRRTWRKIRRGLG